MALPFASNFIRQEGSPVNFRGYYLRRVTRLEPPYVLHLLIIVIILLFLGKPLSEVVSSFFASFFYMSNVVYGQFSPFIINPVTWSLEIEIQFYLLAPLFCQVFRLNRNIREFVIVLFVLVVYVFGHFVTNKWGAFPVTLLNYLPYFGVGFLLANKYVQDWNEKSPSHYVFDLVALASWILLLAIFQFKLPAMVLIVSGILYMAVGASLQSKFVKYILASRLVMTIGGMCYSIYLLHYPLLHWLVPVIHPSINPNTFSGMFVATFLFGIPILVVCASYFVLCERPCMQRNWWR